MRLWYPSYVTEDDKPFIQHAVRYHPEFLRDDFAYIRLCRALHENTERIRAEVKV